MDRTHFPLVDHDIRKQGVLNVRIGTFCFALVAGLSLVVSTASAQAPAGNAAAPAAQQRPTIPVAVIDLGFILNNHPTMKSQIDQIKSESEGVGQEFEKERQQILKMMEELRAEYTEGTADYTKKEAEIAARDTDFRLRVVRKNKEFDEKRAQIFFAVHQQVYAEVQVYCQYAGTFVVLKVNREKPDPKKPQTIENAMMQDVFYHIEHPSVDITNWVLDRLKQQAGATGAAAAPTKAATAPNGNSPRLK